MSNSGALYRHGVILIQVHHRGLRAWAILHTIVYTGRKLTRMYLPAATDGLHGVVLGDLKSQRRQIKDLACFASYAKGSLL